MLSKSIGAHTGSLWRLPSAISPATTWSSLLSGVGVRREVVGTWASSRASPRKGGDPADVYPYGDLWGGHLL